MGPSVPSLSSGNTVLVTLLLQHADSLSCVRLFVTPWTVAHQAPLSLGFSRQEYRSGLPFPPPILLIGGCKIPWCCVPPIWGSQASFLPNTIQDLLWLSLSLFPGALLSFRASLVTQVVKYPPAMWETQVRSLGWEDPWRRKWQPTPVFLSGESPWTDEPGGLQSMGLQRVKHGWATSLSFPFLSYFHLAMKGRGEMGLCQIVLQLRFQFKSRSKLYSFFL